MVYLQSVEIHSGSKNLKESILIARIHLGTILEKLKIKKIKRKSMVWPDCEISINELTDHSTPRDSRMAMAKSQKTKRDKGYMGQMSFPEDMNKVSRTVMSFSAIASGKVLSYQMEKLVLDILR